MPTRLTDWRPPPLIPTCNWQSTISSARYLHRPIHHPFRVMRTGCLRGSATSSRTALPIRISARARPQPKRESRCVTYRSCSRHVARPAANSFTRFVWITPRAFCIAAPRWRQASLSARSRTPAASATTPISRGDFAIASATRQAVAPDEKQCAPVRAKGRHGHTTSGLRQFRSCPQDRSRSSRRIKSRAYVRLMREPACGRGPATKSEAIDDHYSRQGMAARPARALKARSNLVRRLIQARDDPRKQRIRAWLRELDDEQLAGLGLTPEDILVLRH